MPTGNAQTGGLIRVTFRSAVAPGEAEQFGAVLASGAIAGVLVAIRSAIAVG